MRYPLLWLAFAIVMVAGATLLSSRDGLWQGVGIAVLVLPLVVLGAVTLAYYLVERFRSSE